MPNLENVTAERASEVSDWCSEAAKTLQGLDTDAAAREWWENQADRPDELRSVLGPYSCHYDFADRLRAEGYEWAGHAGGLCAERDIQEQEAAESAAVERIANHFVAYLFDKYKGSNHVRRVATWIGLLLKAIQRVAGDSLAQSRNRQIAFEYRGRRFKACYRHDAGFRGGIQIVEVLRQRGAPETGVAATITSLAEADAVYNDLQVRLDEFIDG